MKEAENNTLVPERISNTNEVLDRAKIEELMVLLKRSPEIAEWLSDMTSIKAKKLYVKAKHIQTVAQINSNNKYRNGYWCTHIYVNGKRKAVLKATEDKIYEFLFNFYQEQDNKTKTFDETFDRFIEGKRDRGRSELTLKEYRRYHKLIPQSIKNKGIYLVMIIKLFVHQNIADFLFGIENRYHF